MSKSITQDMKYRQSLMQYAAKYGVSRASRKYNKMCIRDSIYSRYYNLIGRMYHTVLWLGEKSSFIGRFAKDDYLNYWEETAYDTVLPLHMKAHYAYEAVQEAQLGNIKNMILFNEDCNYNYCIVETDRGSYIYAFPYESGEGGIRIHDKAQRGTLYTDAEEFRQLYTERMNNPHFVEGGLIAEPIEPEK